MHRYVAFVLLLSLFLFPCTSFAADLNGVQFTQGEPHRSLDFRQYFELMTTTQEPCTLSIQSEIFDSDQVYSLFCTVMEDTLFFLPLGDMKTARDVRRFLYDAEAGTMALLSFVKEQAPDPLLQRAARLIF